MWEASLELGIAINLGAMRSPVTPLAQQEHTPTAAVGGAVGSGSSASLAFGLQNSSVPSCNLLSSAASQGGVPPLLSLRRALMPHIQAAAQRLVLEGPLRDLGPRPLLAPKETTSPASPPAARKSPSSRGALQAAPWKTRSPGAVGAGAIAGRAPMSPLSSSDERGANLLSPCSVPGSASLSLSSAAAPSALPLSPTLHSLGVGASGPAGGGKQGSEFDEWQDAAYTEELRERSQVLPDDDSLVQCSAWQDSALPPPGAAAKDSHSVPRDEWGDFNDNVGRAHAGWMEVKEEEWGDFDEGVDETLDFPSGMIRVRFVIPFLSCLVPHRGVVRFSRCKQDMHLKACTYLCLSTCTGIMSKEGKG